MLAVFACLAGVFILLLASELLGRKKNWRGDLQRQFAHITVGGFVAFWPWIISWHTIAWIGVAMLLGVLLNIKLRLLDFHTGLNRETYGEIFYALAIISAALITDQKVFFALALLTMAIADGLANIIGKRYEKKWRYKVLGHSKTVIGSMMVWISSLFVLAIGLLFANSFIDFTAYQVLVLVLPPIVVILENISLVGLDNLAIPVVILLALNLAK